MFVRESTTAYGLHSFLNTFLVLRSFVLVEILRDRRRKFSKSNRASSRRSNNRYDQCLSSNLWCGRKKPKRKIPIYLSLDEQTIAVVWWQWQVRGTRIRNFTYEACERRTVLVGAGERDVLRGDGGGKRRNGTF